MDPQSPEWLAQVTEAPIDPNRVEIVDPHHHLWPDGGALPYGVDDLVADTTSGHRIHRDRLHRVSRRLPAPTVRPTYDRSARPSSWPNAPTNWRNVTPDAAPIGGIVANVG